MTASLKSRSRGRKTCLLRGLLADLRKAFADGAFFHVEMFVALPGKFAELYKEREMENVYSKALKQPENFIFVRDQGAAWDISPSACFAT